MENFMESLRKWKKDCFEGEVTMPKVTFWLAAAVCLLAGVVYGLLKAPMTAGYHKYVGCNISAAEESAAVKETKRNRKAFNIWINARKVG